MPSAVKTKIHVSNKGRVAGVFGVKTFGSPTGNGYKMVHVSDAEYLVHILVAWAFLGEPETSKHTVDHIDRQRSNNAVENLRYATAKEQAKNRRIVKRKRAASEDEREDEIWLPLGWDGCKISDKGRVRRKNNFITRGTPLLAGYRAIRIQNEGWLVHSLVALKFLSKKPSPHHSVDHIDGNRQNNYANNLRWLTPSEQLLHSYALGRVAKGCPKAVEYRKLGDEKWLFAKSGACLQAQLGVSRGNIAKCCRGKDGRKTAGGYEFRYVAQPDLPGEIWKAIYVPLDKPAQDTERGEPRAKRMRLHEPTE